MRDYKFNHSGLDFDKPKRPIGRWLLRLTILALVCFGAYLVYESIDWDDTGTPLRTSDDPNVIPLEIPPYEAPASQPADGKVGRTRESAPKIVATPASLAQTTTAIQTVRPSGWIDHTVKSGETLTQIFHQHDLSPSLVHRILASSSDTKQLERIRPGDQLRIHLDDTFEFTEFRLKLDSLRSLSFKSTDRGIETAELEKPTQTRIRTATGVIEQSLFASARAADIPTAVTNQIVAVFGWDIDFALEVRAGDRFAVAYEEKVTADGVAVDSGAVLAAEFKNKGKTYQAVRFKERSGKVGYYDARGIPMKKTFFRTPVKFTRISSGYSKRRWHPVLNRARAHRGVDYAAPTGTPVIATGDGVVQLKGRTKGYGRVVYLKHGRHYRTVYGHLSRFAKGIKQGDQVKQGDIIGYVGQSGLATGPHLHYEFHVDGVQKNPLTVKAPMADPLYGREKKSFDMAAKPLLARLDATKNNLLADAR